MANVRVPWAEVGRAMGGISEGAIVQHLAKVRGHLHEKGVAVPPPLKRGGGNVLVAVPRAVATGNKSNAKRRNKVNDSDTQDEENWVDEDEEEGMTKGKVPVFKKASASGLKIETGNIKKELVEGNILKGAIIRKRRLTSSEDDDAGYGTNHGSAKEGPPARRLRRKIGNNDNDKNKDVSEYGGSLVGLGRGATSHNKVAGGANFLEQESESDGSASSKQAVARRTKIARLPVGKEEHIKAFLEGLGYDAGGSGETTQEDGSKSTVSVSAAASPTSHSVGHGYLQVSGANQMQAYQNPYGSSFAGGSGYGFGDHPEASFSYRDNVLPTLDGIQVAYRTDTHDYVYVRDNTTATGQQSTFGNGRSNAAIADLPINSFQYSGLPDLSGMAFTQSFEPAGNAYEQVQRYVAAANAHLPGSQNGTSSGYMTNHRATPQRQQIALKDYGNVVAGQAAGVLDDNESYSSPFNGVNEAGTDQSTLDWGDFGDDNAAPGPGEM
ncbi:MAG: hypothetical protein Q9191_003240 [Dirinaria sp. TL-2023a]